MLMQEYLWKTVTLKDEELKKNREPNPKSNFIVLPTLGAATSEAQPMVYLGTCNAAYEMWFLNTCLQ